MGQIIEWLQGISWWLAGICYKLIPEAYGIFEFFAKMKFFSNNELANLWNNLYIVMSVLVLFAIGIKLINAIVNPDVLDSGGDKKKKSAKSAFFDAIIAVFLIILVPIAFSALNTLQNEIIDSKFIQKYIFGVQFVNEEETSVGQVLAYQTLTSFVYPCSKERDGDKCTNPNEGENRLNAVSWDIRNIDQYIGAEDFVSDGIGDGIIHGNSLVYHPVLGLASAILVLYQVILMALDMALRAVKIGLLEMMTPIVLGAFIFNREILTKWVKEFIATYLGAFLKLIAVTMMVLGLSRINDLFAQYEKSIESQDSEIAKGLLRLILLMGILRLAKEVPDIINKIFGTNIKYQGGIAGRLGQMAGIGQLAQNAWNTLRHHPIQTSRRLIGAPLSAIGGAAAHGVAAGNAARLQWQKGNRGAAVRTALGGVLGMGGAAVRGGQQGWRYGNLRGIGAQGRRYEDTHKAYSTFGGRLLDDAREALGLETREAIFVRNAERAQKARSALTSARQSAQQLVTSEHSTYRNANGHTAYELRQQIETLSQGAPVRSDYKIDDYRTRATDNLVAGFRAQAVTNLGAGATEEQIRAEALNLSGVTDAQIQTEATNLANRDYTNALNAHMAELNNLQTEYEGTVEAGTLEILNNASSDHANLRHYTDATDDGNELASATLNSIIQQIGTYGANMRMEQIGAIPPEHLENIGNGTLGTDMERLIYGGVDAHGVHHSGVDDLLTDFTQMYDATGTATARGRANADQRSRDNRYVDNARPPHGGGGNAGGGNGGH